MLAPPKHQDETLRLATIRELELLNHERDEAFDRVVRLAQLLFDVPISAFSVVGADEQLFKASVGLTDRTTSREASFCGHAILQDELLEVDDASDDPRFADNPLVTGGPGIRFYAGAPVHAPNGLPLGSLCVIDRVPRQLDDRQRRALRDLRDILQNEILQRSRIFRDHLTQLFNRRFLDDHLDRETRRAYRDQMPMTVMMIDVDHFKSYNDRYGHLAGDEVLRQLGAMIEASCQRPGDIAARYGGEEFAMVLPGAGVQGAGLVAQRLRERLRKAALPHEAGIGGQVTVSIGGVVAIDRAELGRGARALLEAADHLLYFAKNAGRDRSEIAEFELKS